MFAVRFPRERTRRKIRASSTGRGVQRHDVWMVRRPHSNSAPSLSALCMQFCGVLVGGDGAYYIVLRVPAVLLFNSMGCYEDYQRNLARTTRSKTSQCRNIHYIPSLLELTPSVTLNNPPHPHPQFLHTRQTLSPVPNSLHTHRNLLPHKRFQLPTSLAPGFQPRLPLLNPRSH